MDNNISKEKILQLLKFFIIEIEKNDFNFDKLNNIDYYWDIVDTNKLYNPNEVNISKSISLGQISEDWEFLTKFMEGKIDRSLIPYDFKLLSSIIRLLEYLKI